MNWTELILTVPVRELEKAEAVASLAAPGGLYTEDYSTLEATVEEIAHIDLIDEELLRADRDTARIHLYVAPDHNPAETEAFLREKLTAAGLSFDLAGRTVNEEDWSTSWKQFYRPSPVGERLFILPAWQEEPEEAKGRAVLRLDPGAAFGTGSHETTRLCLTVLEKYAREGVRMLDVGCGSGILAIACAKLGVTDAYGVDIDPVAVRVAKENARENGVDGCISFLCGDLAEQVEGPFDLVAANLVADVIKRLLTTLPGLMKPGAVAVFSGIIDTREEEMVKAISDAGLTVVSVLRERGWVAIEAVRERAGA